jgi:peptidyl-prolyl cis-trans isomerase C
MHSGAALKRMTRHSALVVFAFGVSWPPAGCTATAIPSALARPLQEGVVAVVNGVPISQARLDAAIQASQEADTPQLRQHVKQQLIVRELFWQKAQQGHYENRPEVLEAVRLARQTAETRLYLMDNIGAAPVTEAQVRSRYEEIVGASGNEEYEQRVIAAPGQPEARVPNYDEVNGAIREELEAQALQEAASRFSEALLDDASIQQ